MFARLTLIVALLLALCNWVPSSALLPLRPVSNEQKREGTMEMTADTCRAKCCESEDCDQGPRTGSECAELNAFCRSLTSHCFAKSGRNACSRNRDSYCASCREKARQICS
ncbi:unnamed protein product [Vitrella brassicaformis CCMP3155]|uniref:Uncharacterized protein n=1 Tax=Vitrella brassicaformis (strain CCMP3155) TaxID=1169540 RepID=A0A0G4H6M7_VITBC|nr:unnamed protein product [Vitrella brassicaformis CCMP3155]|eukprot:CEM39314.1 unnamed protein product [Vitrella brassicaformis CCMP3155]